MIGIVVSLLQENQQKVQAKIHQYTLNFTLQLKANCFELCCFQIPKTNRYNLTKNKKTIDKKKQ